MCMLQKAGARIRHLQDSRGPYKTVTRIYKTVASTYKTVTSTYKTVSSPATTRTSDKLAALLEHVAVRGALVHAAEGRGLVVGFGFRV